MMESGTSAYPKLKSELDSWRNYFNQLRNDDKNLYQDLIARVWPFADAIEKSGRGYTTESLLISLILSQQKSINWMLNKIKTTGSINREIAP